MPKIHFWLLELLLARRLTNIRYFDISFMFINFLFGKFTWIFFSLHPKEKKKQKKTYLFERNIEKKLSAISDNLVFQFKQILHLKINHFDVLIINCYYILRQSLRCTKHSVLAARSSVIIIGKKFHRSSNSIQLGCNVFVSDDIVFSENFVVCTAHVGVPAVLSFASRFDAYDDLGLN